MKLDLTQDDIDIIKGDLICCLDMNIHGHILGTKKKTLSKLPLHLREQLVDSMFAYLSAWDKENQ